METISFSTLASHFAVEYAAHLGKYKNFDGEITFSFPSGCSYDPFGMLLISAASRQFKERNPDAKCFCHADPNKGACAYAGHMGFFKAISAQLPYGKAPGEALGSEKYMPITSLDLEEIRQQAIQEGVPVQQHIQTISERLSGILAQGNISLQQTFTYVLREIIRNSEEHSRASKVWLCAQYWPYYHLVEFAILDEGIGIQRSLKSNRVFSRSIKNDKDALKLSLMPGITEAYKRRDFDDGDWTNSGYGLYIAKEICSRLGGLFLIASGTSCIGLHTRNNRSEPIDEDTLINGTAICVRFKTNAVDNFDLLRKTIILDGQEEARLVKNTIKKASYSSGGLIDLLK